MASADARRARKKQSQKPHTQTRRDGAPIYDDVGSVKRHVECASRERLVFSSPKRNSSLSFIDQGSLRESNGGNWFHQPSIRSPRRGVMIRSSDPAIARGSKVPNQNHGVLACTRVPRGLPCLRTSCAYSAALRSIQYIRTANLRAMATLATACPLRNFNR